MQNFKLFFNTEKSAPKKAPNNLKRITLLTINSLTNKSKKPKIKNKYSNKKYLL